MDRRLTRRRLVQGGAAATAGAALLGVAACNGDDDGDGGDARVESQRDRGNAVLLIIDTLRADHVYGDRARTPALDALAEESLRFTRAVPEAMPTVPARRAIATGIRSFPFRNWEAEPNLPQQPGWMSIPDHQVQFLEWAQKADIATGYATDVPFLVGPRFRDFREKAGSVATVPGQVPFGSAPGDPVPPREARRFLPEALHDTEAEERLRRYLGAEVNRNRRREEDWLAPRVYREGMRLLDELREEQPFLLVIDTFDPHEAWDPPAKYRRMYGEAQMEPVEPIQPFETPFGMVEDLELGDELLGRARQLYAAEVTMVDAWVGRFVERLDELGLADSTLVMVISDHGMTLGERGVIGKKASEVFKEIYDVPCMIRHPEGKRAGQESGFFASTHDVAPTLLSWCGARVPGQMDGEDLTVLLEGAEPPDRPYFTASYADNVIAGDGRWLLLSDNRGRRRRLYDNESDPNQTEDVAGDHGDVVDRLWRNVLDDAGGTLPRFGERGVAAG